MTTPRLRVSLDTGETYEVQTTNADAVRFDVTRPRKKWPTTSEAPILWATFLAWCALKREGVDLDLDAALEERIVAVEFLDREGEVVEDADTADLDGADPTPPVR